MGAVTAEQLGRARRLLADGASYREAGRTVGCDPSTLARHLPGFGMSAQQGLQLGREIQRHA